MIVGKIRKWGNSYGVLIPKKELEELNIAKDQEVIVDIARKENPLKELFGFGKKDKITRDEFLKTRELLEGRF